MHSKIKLARANEILVAPLFIVLIQSSMKDVIYDVYQMKDEKQSFKHMYNSYRKSVIVIEIWCRESRFRLFWDALYIYIYTYTYRGDNDLWPQSFTLTFDLD